MIERAAYRVLFKLFFFIVVFFFFFFLKHKHNQIIISDPSSSHPRSILTLSPSFAALSLLSLFSLSSPFPSSLDEVHVL